LRGGGQSLDREIWRSSPALNTRRGETARKKKDKGGGEWRKSGRKKTPAFQPRTVGIKKKGGSAEGRTKRDKEGEKSVQKLAPSVARKKSLSPRKGSENPWKARQGKFGDGGGRVTLCVEGGEPCLLGGSLRGGGKLLARASCNRQVGLSRKKHN